MKSKLVVIVESVEDAIKFYTEKLSFDLLDVEIEQNKPSILLAATLKKGKFLITFRRPVVEEFAAFSFIKRCADRCISVSVELKRDIDRFFQRCIKKNVKVIRELNEKGCGSREFVIRDPFGLEVAFTQAKEPMIIPAREAQLCGFAFDHTSLACEGSRYCDEMSALIVEHLRSFGIVRRAAKKLVKTRIKELQA